MPQRLAHKRSGTVYETKAFNSPRSANKQDDGFLFESELIPANRQATETCKHLEKLAPRNCRTMRAHAMAYRKEDPRNVGVVRNRGFSEKVINERGSTLEDRRITRFQRGILSSK
jgi:hypothetical protein